MARKAARNAKIPGQKARILSSVSDRCYYSHASRRGTILLEELPHGFVTPTCRVIQSTISASATGAIVSSISAYSEGAPVVQVWNK